MVLLSVQNLTTTFLLERRKIKVVDNLSFELQSGQTLALVGESGCGKSMTALSILRILPKPPAIGSTGEVLFKEQNLLSLPEKKMRKIRGSKIAMIFQDPMSALNPVYTIGSQLLEVVQLHLGLQGKEAEERAIAALEEVNLPHPKMRMREYPHQMSGGMLQRAMIAMALLCEPDVLIADEPTTALDMTIQAQILVLLSELQKKKGMGIILITHDMGVVAEIADDVIVMYASQQIEQGSVRQIFDNAAHPYTQGLFQSRPDRPLREGKLWTIKGHVPPITSIPQGCSFHPRCPDAMPFCHENPVPHFSLSATTHKARCWLYDKDLELKIELPDDETS
ncbi:MAG: Oligopeptide transport ATP-binding protein OppD [Chlamydiae bacterium]|nr:Oligopeptide transport ATP-binding protein OppD [Chlamydiota bacterium]